VVGNLTWNANGTVKTLLQDNAYAPYGESYAVQGPTYPDYSFTGQHSDVSHLLDFVFREYHLSQGRWMSPDPLGGDVTNPQSLNRYAYTLNNPMRFIDPLGLDCEDPEDPSPCVDIGITTITVTAQAPPAIPVRSSATVAAPHRISRNHRDSRWESERPVRPTAHA